MNIIFRSWLRAGQSRIERRLNPSKRASDGRPVLTARSVDYAVSQRDRAIIHGGIGVFHTLVHRVGLPQAIDDRLRVLKVHLPYCESDHVLNLAYNALCQGT